MLNIGDITKADEKVAPDFNAMFGGSPCQDFSIAGDQKGSIWQCNSCGHEYNPLEAHYLGRNCCPKCGSEEIVKTRSSLLVEWLRFLREKKPRFAIYENVKNLIGKRFHTTFELFLKELEEYGYNVYWKVLNAKDYGIPQNRERVYCVIIRKDCDNGQFEFPKPIPLTKLLSDMLEDNVGERYYLSDEKVSQMISSLPRGREREGGAKLSNKGQQFEGYSDVALTLMARDYKGFGNQQITGVIESVKPAAIRGRYAESGGTQQQIEERKDGCINTITTVQKDNVLLSRQDSHPKIRVRKLTQKECWRLMGFDDTDYERAKQALNDNLYQGVDRSGSQLYKQAGNSIVVDVLLHIMENLYDAMPHLFDRLVIGSFFSGIGAFEKALTRLQPRDKEIPDEDCDHPKNGELTQIGYINGYNGDANRIYDGNGLCRVLKAEAGGGGAKTGWCTVDDKVKIRQATKDGNIECVLGGVADLSYPNSKTRRGRVQGGGEICPTITATQTGICRIEKE